MRLERLERAVQELSKELWNINHGWVATYKTVLHGLSILRAQIKEEQVRMDVHWSHPSHLRRKNDPKL